MDFDKAGNSEDLDNEKLQLICKAYNRELLSNQRVVECINLIAPKKSKIILDSRKFNDTSIIVELLKNQNTLENIKLIPIPAIQATNRQ